ncbi:YciI family protein [Xylanimonas ulmi]|uniref:YCII-related domain-containing protein n=1 Tax=Xylanimonas ulmi TaxID=228973 RepID=A0A4Q7M4G1_9MICO|nr:YciI family protein [Xylanibacterium ulmi]RZS62855.1 hypothetical protein EV386_3209 [Xylanibacterium ulmi]
MTRYLISFDDGAMTVSGEDLAAAGVASHAVVRAAQAAGVWVFGGRLQRQRATVVSADGTVVDGPFPETKAVVGGFCVLDVPTRADAEAWAVQFAWACRCDQEVREIMDDPDV